jgi:SRSO17 transposase
VIGTVSEVGLAASFVPLLAAFSECFTAPSFETFRFVCSGWLLCRGRHTVTGLIQAGGVVGVKHHTSFHRFFRLGRWEPDRVGLALLKLVLMLVPPEQPLVLAIDDTLARHSGKRIASAGMHRDPLVSTATKAFFHFGHCAGYRAWPGNHS